MTENAENQIFDYIDNEVKNNEIVLFMKGTRNFPQCGFSSMTVAILQTLGLKFRDINVLTDDVLRQAIKKYSDWPTIPQLYIKGNFIGGCDIVKEMYENGDLSSLIKEELHNSSKKTMIVSDEKTGNKDQNENQSENQKNA